MPGATETLVLWCDGAHSAGENMRRDAALLEATASHPDRLPVLRLFSFDPPGVTLGHAQTPERALDLERCQKDGIEWAVRPTGGRAIFHAQEWTYSLAARLDDPQWGGSLSGAYAAVSSLLCRSLRLVGVPAELAAGRRGNDSGAEAHHACFASTARHEVLLEGRKLVGSAQRRTARALLQQGSVILGPGHARLADYLAVDDASREGVRQRLRVSTAEAGAWLGESQGLERWAEAIERSFETRISRLDAAAGEKLLTMAEGAPYTGQPSQTGL